MRQLRIRADRLERTTENLGSIGRDGVGITRLPLSGEDLEARAYVIGLMEEAGLEVSIDPVGNIHGRRTQALDPSLPAVMTGSHICTGLCYGKYDGTIGVLGALEAVRVLNDHDVTTINPIEVVVFTAEEPHRFGCFLPGSRAMAGKLRPDELHACTDRNGVSLWQALKDAGYHPEDLDRVRRTRDTVRCYVEMHIEQGRVLEDAGKRIGVVTDIAAPTRFEVTVDGQADHSGATPMGLRKDALCAAAELILALEESGRREAAHASVATVGYIEVEPGSMVVIPGKARMLVDIRGIDSASRSRIVQDMEEELRRISRVRQVGITARPVQKDEPVPLSGEMIGVIQETCEQLGVDAMKMPSGAGHDAQQVATFTDVGMIFVPSVGGVSHSPDEYTSIEDIALGTTVLTHVLLKLSGEADETHGPELH